MTNTFNSIFPLFVSKYDTFSATENDSLVNKINAVINALNKVGKLTNEVVADWNKVMLWVTNEGLNESVETVLLNGIDVIIESPNGTKYKLIVNDAGVLSTQIV